MQGLSGLRAVDKRHMTMYIPFLYMIIIFNEPHVCTLDNTLRLAIQLAKVFDSIRREQYSEVDIMELNKLCLR